MVLLFCSDWVLFKRCPSPHRFTLEQTHIPTLQICFHTDAAYKQCNSVVMKLFGLSLQVCGALFPHVWQDGDLFLHCCLLRPVVNKLTNCKCSIYPWRVCVYSVCSYLFLSVLHQAELAGAGSLGVSHALVGVGHGLFRNHLRLLLPWEVSSDEHRSKKRT